MLLKRKDTLKAWLAPLKAATSVSKEYISYQETQKYHSSITKLPTAAIIDNRLATWDVLELFESTILHEDRPLHQPLKIKEVEKKF